MKSILDPSFRYVPSFSTDLEKTFARIRRDARIADDRPAPRVAAVPPKVSSIVGKNVLAWR